ncbi:hypothetical protein CEK28_15270 [Xenophilus sp. AP218F]|nr:hypothetical protein CEK28_15270 [Xenophilus sp. AP218F]
MIKRRQAACWLAWALLQTGGAWAAEAPAAPAEAMAQEEAAPGDAAGKEEAAPAEAAEKEDAAPGEAAGKEEAAPAEAAGKEEAAPADAAAKEEAAPAANEPYSRARSIEFGFTASSLSAGNPSWRGVYAAGVWQTDESNVFDWIAEQDSRFDEHGIALNGGWNHDFNPDWFGRLELGRSSSGTFWPGTHYGAAINRKWLPERNLVTTFGLAYNDNREGYSDRVLTVGLVYYFESPWVVEGGVHRTLSDPGSVASMQGYGAVTYGRSGKRLVTFAINAGGEGYMPIGINQPRQLFDSQLYQLSWREWLGKHWGVHAGTEFYHSPYYERTGVTAAVFWDLP